ncbi:MAG: multicopper oxidase family protein [Candidatus Nanoarchaeia archaeon]
MKNKKLDWESILVAVVLSVVAVYLVMWGMMGSMHMKMMDGQMMNMDGMEMQDTSMDMDHQMDGMEMTDLSTLPLEEPQSKLEPEVITENGQEIKVFNMTIEAIKKEIRPGVFVEAWGFNRQVPGPEFRVQEGDRVRVHFTNKHTKEHTIHWHGIHVPTEMDGVPGISQEPVKPNETFTYEFIAGPSGTHMYHCHVDTDHHMDMGMYGAFIIEDKDEDLTKYDTEITWVLSEFNTKHNPALHKEWESEYFSKHFQYKVDYDHYLINGKAFPATTPISVKEGDLVKLRMIHAGKTPKSFHIHGHSFKVTHKDGFPVENPQEMDTLPILPGERYDLEIKANNPGAWVFHDHITKQVTNDGFYPGGALGVILYEGYTSDTLQDYLASIKTYNQEAARLGKPPEQH